jgi:hypothetical protein
MRRMALVATVCLMLHSIVDFPLRTVAMASVMALLVGFASPPPRSAKPGIASQNAPG